MRNLFRNNSFLITLIYALVITVLQLTNGWYQNFSDAVHYLWIADKYAEGEWHNAINTYWGPMISWLLLILKPLIAEPFIRFRVLQVLLGLIALLLIDRILRKKGIESTYNLLFTSVMSPLFASFAWFYLTPDLLLVDGVLLTTLFLFNDLRLSFKNAMMTAALGAMLFFIKSIGLYLFIIILAGRFILNKSHWNIKHLLHSSLIAFFLAVFCAPWIYLISNKNGSFTMGTGSIHNYKLNSPRVTPDIYGELGNPHHKGQLTEPEPPGAFDSWMEPLQEPYMSWEGYEREEITKIYKQIIIKNLKSARSMYFGLDIGSIFVLLFVAAVIFSRKQVRTYIAQNSVLFMIFTGNVLLYLPFFFMDRYTWPGLVALFLASVILLFSVPFLNKKAIVLSVAGLFLALNLFSVYKEHVYCQPEKPIVSAIWETKQTTEMKRSVWICSKDDKRLGLVKGLIYYNNGQYLGAMFYDVYSPEEISLQLSKFKINTIITFDPLPDSLTAYLNTKKFYDKPSLKLYKYTAVTVQKFNKSDSVEPPYSVEKGSK